MKNKKIKNCKLNREFSVMMIILSLIMLVFSILILFPIFWGILKSFQSRDDFFAQFLLASSFPKEFTFDNYISSFSRIQYKLPLEFGGRTIYYMEMFLYSFMYAGGCALIATMTPCIVAYLTTKFKFKFNKVVNGIFFFALLFPIVGSMPSMVQVMTKLRLINTWLGIYLTKLNFLGSSYLIFCATFKSLSNDYAEAAIVEGASHTRIMFSIMFPLVKTTIMILFTTSFIGFWNDYQTPMVYLSRYPTASYGLYQFSKAASSYEDYVIYKAAGFMLLILPTLIIFIFMKDKMIGNLTVGGIK